MTPDERPPTATETIHWETDMSIALKRAKMEHKPVFLDFFNPD
jgi:hypothetical protein